MRTLPRRHRPLLRFASASRDDSFDPLHRPRGDCPPPAGGRDSSLGMTPTARADRRRGRAPGSSVSSMRSIIGVGRAVLGGRRPRAAGAGRAARRLVQQRHPGVHDRAHDLHRGLGRGAPARVAAIPGRRASRPSSIILAEEMIWPESISYSVGGLRRRHARDRVHRRAGPGSRAPRRGRRMPSPSSSRSTSAIPRATGPACSALIPVSGPRVGGRLRLREPPSQDRGAASSAPPAWSASRPPRRAPRWPRSARASPARCTTSSRTA